MTIEDSLAFLETHQPLPRDNEVTQAQLDAYREILDTAEKEGLHPDLVGPLLGSLGVDGAAGLQEAVIDLLRQVDLQVLVPPLLTALDSPISSVRQGALQVADDVEDPLVKLVVRRLAASDPDEDTRRAAITTIVARREPGAAQVLDQSGLTWEKAELDYMRRHLRTGH